jgi:hypothetical protein
MILVTLGSGMGEMWGSLTSLKLECMCRPRLTCGIQALLRQKIWIRMFRHDKTSRWGSYLKVLMEVSWDELP